MPTGAQTRATLAGVGGGVSLAGGISVGTLVGHVVADISGFTKGLTKATKDLKNFSTRMDTFLKKNATSMRRLGMRAAVVGAAVVAGVGAMVKTYGEFERRMRRATAVSEVSEEQFLEMSKMAEEASVRLNIAATGAADAFYYLGSAGLTATEQMEAFPPIATMSKAAVIDLKFSADMMVGTMKAYRMSFAETAEVTNIFTEAVTSSNMTFSDLGETLALTAAIGKLTNNSIAELTAMIGLMADTNIKGSRAGTSLRRSLLNLAAPSSEVRVEMAKWGVEVYDAERKMKPFVQIVGEFGEALKNATEEQKNLTFKTLFGVRAITGQLAIFDLGIEKVQAFVDQLNAAGDSSERIAKKQMKAFMEQIGRVGQGVAKLARHIGMSLAPAISNLADKLIPAIDNMTKWVDANKDLITALMATAAAMGIMALVSGTLTMGLAGLAIAAIGLGVTVVGLGVAIAAATLGIGAFVGSIVYVIARIMRMRKEIILLKKELELGEPLRKLEALMTELKPSVEAGVKGAEKALSLLYKNWRQLGEIEDEIRAALHATRSELLEMTKDYKFGKLLIVAPTEEIRGIILRELTNIRDMYTEMTDANIKTVERMLRATTKTTKVETRKQMTIYEVAAEERKRERTEEFDDWVTKTDAWAGKWEEMEYRRIVATKDAIDDTQDAMTSFFTETLIDAENWKDHLINFLADIQRAMARVFATRIAEELMAHALVGPIMGGLYGGIGGGGGGGPGAPPGGWEALRTRAGIGSAQHGGLFTRPTITTIAEKGAEAVIPLSGGRNIPVEMRGGVPNVTVNVINQTSRSISAHRGPVRFDGRKLITEVILEDSAGYGPLKSAGIIS